jgi:hypothetical protein
MLVAGCSNGNHRSSAISVSLGRSSVTTDVTSTLQLTASVQNDPKNSGVTWAIAQGGGGTLTNSTATSTIYTATASAGQATIIATSVADSSKSARLVVNIAPNPTLTQPPSQSLIVTIGKPYTLDLKSILHDGTPPFTWSITQGTLPVGLSLNSSTGVISGSASAAALIDNLAALQAASSIDAITAQVADNSMPSQSASITLTLTVNSGTSQNVGIVFTIPETPGEAVLGTDFALSATGRYAAFVGSASPGAPSKGNVLIHDFCIGESDCTSSTELASSTGTASSPGNGESFMPFISRDGRLVAFVSLATDLDPNVSVKFKQVYVHDTCHGAPSDCLKRTVLASRTDSGEPNAAVGSAFDAHTGAETGGEFSMTSDGTKIFYLSQATDLGQGTQPGGIYSEDLDCPLATGVACSEVISLVIQPDPTVLSATTPLASNAGKRMAYNGNIDRGGGDLIGEIFAKTVCSGTQICPPPDLVSVDNDTGLPGSSSLTGSFHPASISEDGRYVVFTSPDALAPNGVQDNGAGRRNLYVRDTCTNENAPVADCKKPSTTTVSVGTDSVGNQTAANDQVFVSNHAISGTGRFIAFTSLASNLVQDGPPPGGVAIGAFVRDTCLNAPVGCVAKTVLVSRDATGAFVPSTEQGAAISADGHYCLFNTPKGLVLALTGF